MLVGLLLRQGRACLLELRFEHVNLLLGARNPGFVAVQLCLFLSQIGLCLLGTCTVP